MTAPPGRAGFRAKYEAAAAANRSLLCVGLDPDPALLPEGADADAWLREVVEATADLVCCFKPNAAFFEARGPGGLEALQALIERIPDGIPVLLDAKRGDVGHAAAFYAQAAFGRLGADAVTVNPYLGSDAVEPFLAWEDRHVFVLCRTSNEGAGEFQDRALDAGWPLFLEVAARANAWNTRGNVGLVVGANWPHEARAVRGLCPDLLLLMPGLGAQGGGTGAVREALDAEGGGVIVSASRSVLYAGGAAGGHAAAARAEASRLRDALNALRGA